MYVFRNVSFRHFSYSRKLSWFTKPCSNHDQEKSDVIKYNSDQIQFLLTVSHRRFIVWRCFHVKQLGPCMKSALSIKLPCLALPRLAHLIGSASLLTVCPLFACADQQNNTCDVKCTKDGCWGPGPTMCFACRDYNRHRSCVDACNILEG